MQSNIYEVKEDQENLFPIHDFDNLICFDGEQFDVSPISTDLIAALYQSKFNDYCSETLLIEKRVILYLKSKGIHMKTDPRKKEYEYKHEKNKNCVIQLIQGTEISEDTKPQQIQQNDISSQSLKMNPLLKRRKKEPTCS